MHETIRKLTPALYIAKWTFGNSSPIERASYCIFTGDGKELVMAARLSRTRRRVAVALGVLTLAGVGVLFVWDAAPQLFPAGAHDVLGAFPLATITVAYLAYQAERRPARAEVLKAVLLAIAFLLWAANQLWPELRAAVYCNDGAIGLFVLDVFLVIVGWPAESPDESFAESYAEPPSSPIE